MKKSNEMTSSNQRNYKQFKPLSECIEAEVVQQPVVSSSSCSSSSLSTAAQNPSKNTSKNQGQTPYPSDYFKIKEETLNDGEEGFKDFKRRSKIKKEKIDQDVEIEIQEDVNVKLFDRRTKSQTNLCSNENSTSTTNTNTNTNANINHNNEDHGRDRIFTFFRRQVTRIDGEIGFAGPDIFFHTTKVRGHPGAQLKVGTVLNLKCEKVEDMPFVWNAVSIYIEEPNASSIALPLPLPVPEYENNTNVNLNVTREEKEKKKDPVKSKAPPFEDQVRNESLNFVPSSSSSSSRMNQNLNLHDTVINTMAGDLDNMMDTIPLYIPPNLHSHPNQKEESSEDYNNHSHHHRHHHSKSKHKHQKKHKHHHKKRGSKSKTRSSSQSSSSSSSRSNSSSSGNSSSSHKKTRKHGHKSRSRKRSKSESITNVPVIPPYQNPFQYQIVDIDPSRSNVPIQVMLVHPPTLSLDPMTLAAFNQNNSNQVQVQRTIINQPPPPPPITTISLREKERERERRREQTPPRHSRYEHLERMKSPSPPQQKQQQQPHRSSREKLQKTEFESKSKPWTYEKYSLENREDRDRALISVKPPWALFESEREKHYSTQKEHIYKDKSSRHSAGGHSELNKIAKSNKLLIKVGGAGHRQIKGDSHSSGSIGRQRERDRDRHRDRDREDIVYNNDDDHRPSSSFSYSSFRSHSYRERDDPHSSGMDRDGHDHRHQQEHHRSPSPLPPPPKLSVKARLGVRSKAAENAHRIITHHLNKFHESTPPLPSPEPPTFNPEQPVMRIARRRVVSPSRLHP